MRLRLILVAALAALVFGAGARAAPAGAGGRLAGATQISFGCPGPQRVGEPCEHWFAFPGAHFALTRRDGAGAALPGTRRVVVSDENGRFDVSLAGGNWTITPLPQAHTRGGPSLTAHVDPGRVTRIAVRFRGFPAMV